jgi:hypothetical protein
MFSKPAKTLSTPSLAAIMDGIHSPRMACFDHKEIGGRRRVSAAVTKGSRINRQEQNRQKQSWGG